MVIALTVINIITMVVHARYDDVTKTLITHATTKSGCKIKLLDPIHAFPKEKSLIKVKELLILSSILNQ